MLENLPSIGLFLLILLISASFHELMHALVAYRLGDDLARSQGRISLNPLVHIDPVLTIGLPALLLLLGAPPILAAKPVPINTSRLKGAEFGLAAVGIAGPLTNLVLAFVIGWITQVWGPTGIVLEIAELAVFVNVALFAFNMLPIPPLDGSRVLYAVAPEPLQRVMRQIESFGIFGLIIFLMIAGSAISPILINIQDFILNFAL